jgi:hypothetical protein
MTKKVPLDTPWTAKDASKWDNRTLGHWLESATKSGIGREMLRTSLGDIFTSDLAEVSLLGALHMLNSNRGFERVVNIKDGHQESRVVGGRRPSSTASRSSSAMPCGYRRRCARCRNAKTASRSFQATPA